METYYIIGPIMFLVFIILVLVGNSIHRKRMAKMQIPLWVIQPGGNHLRPPTKTVEPGTLCAICLSPVTEESYGQTNCCKNFLHHRCFNQYCTSGAATSDKCCLCQNKASSAPVVILASPVYAYPGSTPYSQSGPMHTDMVNPYNHQAVSHMHGHTPHDSTNPHPQY